MSKPLNSLVGATPAEVLSLTESLAVELGGTVADGLVMGYRIKVGERGTYVASVSAFKGVEVMVYKHGRMDKRQIFGSVSELASQIRAAHAANK